MRTVQLSSEALATILVALDELESEMIKDRAHIFATKESRAACDRTCERIAKARKELGV